MHHHKKGYIIVMTMLIIGLSVAIVTYIYKRGTLYGPLAQLAAHKEKARMLTQSGLQIALAQLGEPQAKKEEPQKEAQASQKTPAAPSGSNETALLYQTLLPRLNRWQPFDLKEEIEGVDAKIKIAIGCEEGKINLNQIYDFSKKKFRPLADGKSDWSSLVQQLCTILEKQSNKKELFEAFKKFLQSRAQPLNDITELLLIKEFIGFKDTIFYEPPQGGQKKEDAQTRPLYLMDIFTLYTQDYKVDPWVFSDSLCGILGLTRAQPGDIENRSKIIEPVLKNFKSTYTWKSDWKPFLEPIYQKELQSLPKGIESVLQETSNPIMFSIYVSATYGKVTQQLYAIVERTKKKDTQDPAYTVEIRKMYTL